MFQQKYFRSFFFNLLSGLRSSSKNKTIDCFPFSLEISGYHHKFSMLPVAESFDFIKAIPQKLSHNRRKAIESLIDALIP